MVDVGRDGSYLFNDEQPSLPKRFYENLRLSAADVPGRMAGSLSSTWRRRNDIARERYLRFKAALNIGTAIKLTPYVLLFLLAFLPAVILGANFPGAFNSPDETTRYLAAQNFAEHGRLYIEDEITLADPTFSTGPRGFAQHNGRSVPTYSQLTLVVLGMAEFLFGSAAQLVLAVIPGALFVALAVLLRRIFPAVPTYLGWIFLGVTPLWYWVSRVYMDLAATYLFIAVALVFLTRAIQTRSEKQLFVGSMMLGIASLARIPEAPFLFFLGGSFILAIGHLKQADGKEHLRLGVMYGSAWFVAFLVPLLILNWWTSGSPLTTSYTLLFDQNFPERVEPATNILLEPFRILSLALFPQPTHLPTIYATFVYQVLLFNPFLLVLGIVGIAQSGGTILRNFGGYGAGILGFAFLYMFVSRSDPGTFLAGTAEPDLRVTLMRYWMPLYVVLGIGAALALAKTPHRIALPVVAAFVISGAYGVWYAGHESVSNLERTVSVISGRFEQFYDEHTEPEALVIAGSSIDKWTVPYRRTIGIWQGTATEANIRHLADTAADAHQRGQPVYFMIGPNEPDNTVDIFNNQLEPEYLGIAFIAQDPAGDLWKVTSRPQTLNLSATGSGENGSPILGAPSEPGTGADEFSTTFASPGRAFTLTIANDGSSRNLVTNPSFEIDDADWNGPAAQGPVEITRNTSEYGSASLRMELFPVTEPGVRVRRTYNLNASEIVSGTWNLRASVKVEDLSNAAVEMLVYVQDRDGKTLAKPMVQLPWTTNGFVDLTLAGQELPENATQIAVQISIVATAGGGNGVAYWDGIEVVDGPALAPEYCDGDNFGCEWEGQPNASPSSRTGGVTALSVSGNDLFINPGVTLKTGASILFENGTAFLMEEDGTLTSLGEYGSVVAGDELRITATSASEPVITVVGP